MVHVAIINVVGEEKSIEYIKYFKTENEAHKFIREFNEKELAVPTDGFKSFAKQMSSSGGK